MKRRITVESWLLRRIRSATPTGVDKNSIREYTDTKYVYTNLLNCLKDPPIKTASSDYADIMERYIADMETRVRLARRAKDFRYIELYSEALDIAEQAYDMLIGIGDTKEV